MKDAAEQNLPNESSHGTSTKNEKPQPFRCQLKWRCRAPGWPHKCSEKLSRNKTNTAKIRILTIACGFPECSAKFKYVKAFDRHYRTKHIQAAELSKLDCPIEGCHRVGENGFTRKDNLTQHQRKVHGEVIPEKLVRFGGSEGGGYDQKTWTRKPIIVEKKKTNTNN